MSKNVTTETAERLPEKTAEDCVEQQRARHHDALRQLAQSLGRLAASTNSGLNIWRNLRRFEQVAHEGAEDYCNSAITDEQWERIKEGTFAKVRTTFNGKLPKGFFVNGDPRGYALKLQPNSVPFALEQDWGGYQILAPEIN